MTRDSLVTDAEGGLAVALDIAPGESSFLLTAVAPDGVRLAVDSVVAPDGERVLWWEPWVFRPFHLTSAVFYNAADVTLAWPPRAEDPALYPGVWTVQLTVVDDEDAPGAALPVAVVAHRKADDDLTRGAVGAVVVLVAPHATDPAVRRAVERAAQRWRAIWRAHGLALSWRVVEADGPATLPDPRYGDAAFSAFAERASGDELVVVVSAGLAGPAGVAGLTGAAPNSLTPTPRSVVAVPWLQHAGIDGVFDDREVRQLGETLAHEAGHYLGLAHPVVLGFDRWDALDDTPTCDDRDTCEAALGGNLMYPYPICDARRCAAADQLTPDQLGVVHRYVGVQ